MIDVDSFDEEIRCPYCNSIDDCEHFLLKLDTYEKTAQGGPLSGAFNDFWYEIVERTGEDIETDELSERFDEEIGSLQNLADNWIGEDFDGGPGMSTDYIYFFCKDKASCVKAVQDFGKYAAETLAN